MDFFKKINNFFSSNDQSNDSNEQKEDSKELELEPDTYFFLAFLLSGFCEEN